MPTRIDPTARARELGAELRRHREAAGITGHDLAKFMNVSPSKVSRMETGTWTPEEKETAVYLAWCRVPGDEVDPLLDICRSIESAGCWLRTHNAETTHTLRSLIAAETAATAITLFSPSLVCGLLQTEDYATELLSRMIGFTPDTVAQRVETRMRRQDMLRREYPADFRFFLNEAVLWCPVGDAKVMHDQMLHLMFTSGRSNVSIRVVPFSAGAHAGMGGSFMLMRYPDHRPVVHVETAVAALFHEKKSDVEIFQAIAADLAKVALSEDESRRMFASRATHFDRQQVRDGQQWVDPDFHRFG